VERIESRSNAKIKAIRKLRNRNERDRAGVFFVEGIRQVSEAARSGGAIADLIVAPDLLRSEFALDLVERQQRSGVPVLQVSADVFASISDRDHPQGLAALARQRWSKLEDVDARPDSLWVALESVADPGNLGTILRTADAVGASGVILLGHSTDPYDPSAVRASMGSVFTQPMLRVKAGDLVSWARRNGVKLAGTSPGAETDYQAADYLRPLVLLMGSERQGLPEELQRACDWLVRLPMAGKVDSLNLAVATGVMLYEIFNQRRHAVGGDRRGRTGSYRAPARGGARSMRRRPPGG
jgi:TrmH family RNA methyltransferase